MNERSCEVCGAPMEGRTRRARYCGSACRTKAHKARVASEPLAAQPAEAAAGPVETAAMVELDAAGVGGLSRATLLSIAKRLDDPATPGGSVAALAKALREGFGRLALEAPAEVQPGSIEAVQAEAARILAGLGASNTASTDGNR